MQSKKDGMTAAIFGLVGVIIGALLTGFVAASSAARRTRRATQTAARLLLVDIATAQSAYEQCLEDGKWMVLPDRPISFVEWEQWKALLAANISGGAEWKKLYTVFVDAQHFNAIAAKHEERDPMSRAVSDAMATALARTDEALPVLAPYARGEHLYRSRLRARLRRLVRR